MKSFSTIIEIQFLNWGIPQDLEIKEVAPFLFHYKHNYLHVSKTFFFRLTKLITFFYKLRHMKRSFIEAAQVYFSYTIHEPIEFSLVDT